jgi:hypothetical protein
LNFFLTDNLAGLTWSIAGNDDRSTKFDCILHFYIFGLMQKNMLVLWLVVLIAAGCANDQAQGNKGSQKDTTSETKNGVAANKGLDTVAYNKLLQHMTNGDTSGLWPAKNPYPLPGAVLPFNRVVSYYGNLYSKLMGALGEFPKDSMLRRLQQEVQKWTAADSMMPAVPALHYIAITAQNAPGPGGTYRMRMPFHQIDTIVNWAKEINALVFIDVQVGLSTIQKELPEFENYLKMPNLHFGIDPEFSMKTGARPGSVIGSFDAADINYVIDYLADIVKKNNLPPKILVIHRFTQGMVTNYKQIKTVPEVQVVMDMDGWGPPAKKVTTYQVFIHREPVQFTGFKIFYKNDTKADVKTEMQPADVLKLKPAPVYIQYQ